jgi:hypothetical protein
LVGLVAMLVPVAVTFEGLPHALRALGSAPFAYLLAGLGAAVLGGWLYGLRMPTVARAAAVAGLGAAILWAAAADTRLYLDEFPERDDLGPSFSVPLVEQADFLETRPGRWYVVYAPHGDWREDGLGLGTAVSQFLLWDEFRDGRLVYVSKEDAPELDVDKPATVAVLSGEPGNWPGGVMADLEARYPNGRVVSGPNGERYFVR